jgi:hypothetical protein
MKITAASSMLMNGWEITRDSWNNEKFIRKISLVSPVEICVEGEFSKWLSTKEDIDAIDWNAYKVPIESTTTNTVRIVNENDEDDEDEIDNSITCKL